MAKILLVDDDPDLLSNLTRCLSLLLYQVETASDGEEAYLMLRARSYDLGIFDWNLPTLSGIDLCLKYRAEGGVMPILMLTGKSDHQAKVAGLDSGADDYLVKPFNHEELLARVKALLRRTSGYQSLHKLVHKDIQLDTNNYRVTKAGKEIKLIPKEFAILELLMRNPQRTFSPEAILNGAWKDDDYPLVEVVRTHIMNIRRKFDEPIIENVHGVGYRITSTD